ncbi:MAG: hypothetical protein WC322_05660 [Candidatus Paceibacterota bacterium]|jgi:hypothetical protein
MYYLTKRNYDERRELIIQFAIDPFAPHLDPVVEARCVSKSRAKKEFDEMSALVQQLNQEVKS